MLETYNLMEDAMLSDEMNMLDNDVIVSVAQQGISDFLKRAKFTENILIPNMDSPLGVVEANAEEFLSSVDGEHFAICIQVLEPGSFISEKAQSKIMEWLENSLIRKSFMLNSYECHILKADLYNDVFVCITVELIEGSAA